MNIDDFLELVHTRRSIRRFKPDAVPQERSKRYWRPGAGPCPGPTHSPGSSWWCRDAGMRAKVVDSWLAPNQEA